MPPRLVPSYIAPSVTEFRRRKRAEIRDAQRALDQLQRGSAFMPREAMRAIDTAITAMRVAKDLCSTNKWGR